jgi:hypothetical protein
VPLGNQHVSRAEQSTRPTLTREQGLCCCDGYDTRLLSLAVREPKEHTQRPVPFWEPWLYLSSHGRLNLDGQW